jgi:hypothetical protein
MMHTFTTRFGIARPQFQINNLTSTMNMHVESKKTISQTWSSSNDLVFPLDESKNSSNPLQLQKSSSHSQSQLQSQTVTEIQKFPMERIKQYLKKELKMDSLDYYPIKPKSPDKIIGFQIPEENDPLKMKWMHEHKKHPIQTKKSLLQGISERIKKTDENRLKIWWT